jgi:Resolvase, N terminal domain
MANRIIRGFARGSCGGLRPWPPSWLGELSDHPKLSEALRACRKHKATLVIAKLDRLARNVHFISGLL